MGSFFKSFAWAGRGLATAIREERNLRFHLSFALYVYFFAGFYPFSRGDYVLITTIVCGVLALELVNSAIERVVDKLQPERHPVAGTIKNIAAAAVLVFCIGAVVSGVLLFWNIQVFTEIFSAFYHNPLWAVLLAASLALAGWFVFGFGRAKGIQDKKGK